MTEMTEEPLGFDKEVSFEADIKFDTDITLDKDIDVDVDVKVDVDIEGNFADFNIDVQAVGDDGAAELNLVVLATDELASITATGYAAVA
jgi:hypothetical protein